MDYMCIDINRKPVVCAPTDNPIPTVTPASQFGGHIIYTATTIIHVTTRQPAGKVTSTSSCHSGQPGELASRSALQTAHLTLSTLINNTAVVQPTLQCKKKPAHSLPKRLQMLSEQTQLKTRMSLNHTLTLVLSTECQYAIVDYLDCRKRPHNYRSMTANSCCALQDSPG